MAGITELSKDKDAVLVMDEVSFGYSEGESAIEQISFTIQPRQTVGLIGGTGCGKSTIVQLLPRLIDPTAGEIRLGGVPLREFSLADLAPSDPDCTAEGGAVFRDDPRESSLGQSRRR